MTKQAAKKSARIEVFRTGEFTPMNGPSVSYSAADLAGIVTNYDPDTAPAPVVVGHPKTDAPAYGWVKGFEYDADADRLYADIDELEPAFADAVKEGRYKKVSMSFFKPDASNNPSPGNWYAKHVGFLGAAAPAVSGLAPVELAGDDAEVVTFVASFGERGFEETASILRNVREFFIEKFGIEDADRVIPSYRLEWLDDTEVTLPLDNPTPSYVEPEPKDTGMTPEEIANLEQRETNVATRETELAALAAEGRTATHTSFAETLVTEGKLLPASKDKVVALLNALPAEAEVSFSEGDTAAPVADALMAILKEQPVAVDFSQADLGGDPDDGSTSSFASDGNAVDTSQLAIDAKARTHMSSNPGMTYIDAVKAVS